MSRTVSESMPQDPPPPCLVPYPDPMTTREELHALIDATPDGELEHLAAKLRRMSENRNRRFRADGTPMPESVGMGDGPSDLGRNTDIYLQGFGQ